MPATLDDLTREMAAFGLLVDRELRWDGAVVRLRMADRPQGDRSGWFIGQEVNGRHYAHFGDWRDRSRDRKWTDNGAGTPHCEAQYAHLLELLRAERESEEAEARAAAALVAAEMWAQASEEAAAAHPYVVKKGVRPHGLRALRPEEDNLLLVPYLDEAGNIATIQTITPEGDKRLVKNGRVKGCCHPIPGDESAVYICEGWATGATIHELTGCKVLVACSANNLGAAAKTARAAWPDARIVIAADNDHKTPGNPGLRYAREAAEAIGAEVAVPEGAGTDFNDMAAEGFPGRAAELLGARVVWRSHAEVRRSPRKPIRWAVKGIIPRGLTILAGPPKFGKSWMMLQLCHDVATGQPAWGFAPTEPGTVFYLDLEDSNDRVQWRTDLQEGYTDQGGEPTENLFYCHNFPRLGNGFMEELRRMLARTPDVRLIVVDTLQKVRPVGNGKRNLYQAEYEDYEKLQKFAVESGIPVVAVHHLRKRGSKSIIANPFDEISGSTGIQGVSDTMIVVCKEGDKGWMFVTGRDVNEETYPIEFTKITMTWTLRDPAGTDAEFLQLGEWFKTHETITAREAAEALMPAGGKPESVKPDSLRRYWHRKLAKWAEEGKLTVEEPKNPKHPTLYKWFIEKTPI